MRSLFLVAALCPLCHLNSVTAQTNVEFGEHGTPVSSSRVSNEQATGRDGDGSVTISGELKRWHKVTLTLDGPFASETDTNPNAFTNYRVSCWLTHESGTPDYEVPCYFAADGDAANSSATAGRKWRAHLSPDKTGVWSYTFTFLRGKNAAVEARAETTEVKPYHGVSGKFTVADSDKAGRDLRAEGRLEYVGKRYLRFAGSGRYFLKAGADAPETLLAYADFDGTVARKKNVPLKTWNAHIADWQPGDPTWGDGRGKGLVGAVNYLSSTGCNAFSFLTYNAGGDGDNVWPFVERESKLHYDCSKLDQWGIVFDHATTRGMFLHFKMQETENDDNLTNRRKKGKERVPESLDGGELGIERKLYCRELVARYAHVLALNWNLGEENTQSTEQQKAMARYIRDLDPYNHPIVVHTYPNEQDKVYGPLLGNQSVLNGCSLQNSHIKDTHWQTVKWVELSTKAKKPWIVAFDESGSAAHGQPPDWGYQGFDGKDSEGKYIYTRHEVRKQTLWGTLMGGGAGVEYYFGYKFPENDLRCEDWRSRHESWLDCKRALDFFHDHEIPFWEMSNADHLVGNPDHTNLVYCLARRGSMYVVYLPGGGSRQLDLSEDGGAFDIHWYNPREGGPLFTSQIKQVNGGRPVSLGLPPRELTKDWVCLLRKSAVESSE